MIENDYYKFQTKKKGFTVPVALWINTILKQSIEETLSERSLKDSKIFDIDYVHNEILKPHYDFKADNSKKIFNLFILVKWMKKNLKDVYFN